MQAIRDYFDLKTPSYWQSLALLGLFAILAVLVPYVGKDQFLVVLGVAFVVIFWMLAWSNPKLILLLIFASAPFQNDLGDPGANANDAAPAGQGGGTHYSFTEVAFALAAPMFVARQLVRKRTFILGPVAITAIFYLGVSLFSQIMNWNEFYDHNKDGITAIAQMILYTQVAVCMFCCYPDQPSDAFPALYALVVVGVFLSIAGFATGSNYFLGLHKNGVGSSMAACAVVAVELWFAARDPRRKMWMGIASFVIFAGLISTLSRGAWIATFVGVMIILGMRGEMKLLGKIALMVVPLFIATYFSLSQENRDYIFGFDASRTNIKDRLTTIDTSKMLFERQPIYGVGVQLRKEYDATDIFWVTLAETGVLGLVSFVAIYFAVGWMTVQTCRRLSRDDPLFTFCVLGAALSYGRVMHGMVDHYWSRGAITTAWGAVGLATAVYYIARDRAYLANGSDWQGGLPLNVQQLQADTE